MKITESPKEKLIKSDGYNLYFNKDNGFTVRCGNKLEDDPQFSPMPEILDIEISKGSCMGKCPMCYKTNGQPKNPTKHMSIDTFRQILDRFEIHGVNCLTQAALGLTDTTSNPDFWLILEECRKRGIIPNFTTHGLDITPEISHKVSKLCGAVAVSIVNKEKSYDTVKMFTDTGMKQVNIHLTIYKERLNFIYKVLSDIKNDPRLSELNAIVLLTYKPKGNGCFTNLNFKEFSDLITHCDSLKINYGMDSCSCHMFEKWIKKNNREELLDYCEKCESGCFSSYISSDGFYYPCSFCEGEYKWKDGIDILSHKNFREIWNGSKNLEFRKKLMENNRKCPIFSISK